METTKDTKTATDARPDHRDSPRSRGDRGDTRTATGADAIPEKVHDEAIEEAVEGIHG